MNRLFEHFNGYDIQAVRKESREEDEAAIQAIVNAAEKYAPDYDIEKIVKDVLAPV